MASSASTHPAPGPRSLRTGTRATLELATLTAFTLLVLVLWALIDVDALSAPMIAGIAGMSAVLVAGTGAIEATARARGETPGELGNLSRLFSVAALLIAAPALLVQVVPAERAPATGFAPHACPEGDVPKAAFRDIRGHPHERSISCGVWWGLTSGVDDGRFGPDAPATVRQLDALLSRVAGAAGAGGAPGTDLGDLPAGAAVSRAQLAAALAAVHDAVLDASHPVLDAFRDDEDHPLERAVNRAAAAGLVTGRGDRAFEPERAVTRAQAVTAVLRLVDRLVAESDLERGELTEA